MFKGSLPRQKAPLRRPRQESEGQNVGGTLQQSHQSADEVRETVYRLACLNGTVPRIWFKRGLTSEDRAKYWSDSMDNVEAFERELSSRGESHFGGDLPGWLDYMVWPWFERVHSYSSIFKVNIHTESRGS